MGRRQTPALVMALALMVTSQTVSTAQVIPFAAALDDASISVKRLDDILEYALLIGNGDINALVYENSGNVEIVLTKNDVWDARLDTKLDPLLPTLKRIKELNRGAWPDRGQILPEGSTWQGPDSYSAHPYPCPRACARLILGTCPVESNPSSLPTTRARLDLRRAVARIDGAADGPPRAVIRALAQRNAFLIEADLAGRLEQFRTADTPDAKAGETNGVRWLYQTIPGDLDWPGMEFAVALAEVGQRKAVAIVTSLESNDAVATAVEEALAVVRADAGPLIRDHEAVWTRFWAASGLEVDDKLMEQTWYRGLYFLRCVSKPGVVAPGLFASLTTGSPAWHGDYHTNYNIQQTFWHCYAANHPELAEPYDRLIRGYFPRARWLARTIFSMNGAFYPHVLYAYEPPDPSKVKSPGGRQYIHHVWGFTLGVSGFTVQPLWWHYKYEPDRRFLEQTAYPAVRDVAVFYADFIDQCERRDGRVVLSPSVSPEHWGWTANFERNRNCTFDIAMVRYILQAAIEGATTLACDSDLVTRFRVELALLPDYPRRQSEEPVVVDVEDAPPINYNIVVPTTPVFPGDVVTWQSSAEQRMLFARTLESIQWNGNNSMVMLGVARARLDMPGTLDWMREEVKARSRPNGTLTLNRLGAHFNSFGHYTEQFAAGMVLSELLLQSVDDVIRVFPAWPEQQDARFHELRAQGGFLVSSSLAAGKIDSVEVESTAGGPLRLVSPWRKIAIRASGEGPSRSLTPDAQGIVQVPTRPGERWVFEANPTDATTSR
jgi:hypothetical protein